MHLGHALNNTIQDILARYYRMNGRNVCWVPGTDHAGIATQARVEQTLYREEKKTRHDLGREKLLDRIWRWRDHYGDTILTQLKKLGCSCDWDRTAFTMDDNLSYAVRKVFLDLYKEGLIYRGKRLINWSVGCLTALSNDEVEHKEVKGNFYHIKYPVAGQEDRYVEIATTRPETMLGDTAVVVHPKDERYWDVIGEMIDLPLTGRQIPIIADDILADPEKGTGAVKCTPAHDFNDYACGMRNKLTMLNIFNKDGTLNENGGKFEGLSIKECRKKVVAELEEQGLLVKVEPHIHSVGHCYRSHTVVEPLLSSQWFVKMDPLVELAKKAVTTKQLSFIPEKRELDYMRWLDSTPDWCISRQIWWGHRIPIWYCTKCNPDIALDQYGDPTNIPENAFPILPESADLEKQPVKCPSCGNEELVQDPDVLDTWFSSQLWPLSTFGWPQSNEDLDYFYPTDVLVTARDIIALWVARMVMMGMKYRKNVTPFKHVYITSTILDEQGDIMSKSRGNGIDPLKVIEGGVDHIKASKGLGNIPANRKEHYPVFGADALRYGIISMIQGQSQDIRMPIRREEMPGKEGEYKVSIPKLEEGRRFANKIYQATFGFVFPNCNDFSFSETKSTNVIDQWLEHRINMAITKIDEDFKAYRLGDACNIIYHLFWDDFCSWYLESVKGRLSGKEGDQSRLMAQNTLILSLYTLVRMLQPIMPFICEEIFSHLKQKLGEGNWEVAEKACIVSPWPNSKEDRLKYKDYPEAYDQTELARKVVSAINNIRSEQSSIKPGQLLPKIFLVSQGKNDSISLPDQLLSAICTLSKVEKIEIAYSKIDTKQTASRIIDNNIEVILPLAGLINTDAEREKLNKEIDRVTDFVDKLASRLENSNFVKRAPAEVVKRDQDRLELEKDKLKTLHEKLEELDRW